MDAQKDYYAVLGVLPTAEDVVIRAAYKALAQRYHPDRFKGSPAEANRLMAELNEAYSILSDHAKRQEYDSLRGTSTQSGDSYFGGGADDAPPTYDPLERDWLIASKFYTDLPDIEARLAKISWRLAYSFRAYLMEEKAFESRQQVAQSLERQFLELYFGTNPTIVAFAKQLISAGQKPAAKALNEAIRILGSKVDPDRIIAQLTTEFDLDGAKARADKARARANGKMVVKICPSCRSTNDESNSVCSRCGTLLAA